MALLIIAILLYWSPKKTTPFYNQKGEASSNAIASIEDIEINNVSQRIVIRGWDKENPILLQLHGGPGGPDRPVIKMINAHVEDLFTVVYWDQRGSGASYQGDIDTSTMTLEQIASDGIALSEYLIKRFDKDKIFIQGHSWGSSVGVTMAKKRPDLFLAYIGIGQMADSKWSEEISYEYTLAAARRAENKEHIEILEELGPPPYPSDEWTENLMKQRQILWKYEHPENELKQSMLSIYMLYIQHSEYSLRDKINLYKGSNFTMRYLWDDAMAVDFFTSAPNLDIPVFILQGKYDKHTSTEVAKAYFDTLKAPLKMYFEFDDSAHAPQFSEYHRYKSILKEKVLNLSLPEE